MMLFLITKERIVNMVLHFSYVTEIFEISLLGLPNRTKELYETDVFAMIVFFPIDVRQ